MITVNVDLIGDINFSQKRRKINLQPLFLRVNNKQNSVLSRKMLKNPFTRDTDMNISRHLQVFCVSFKQFVFQVPFEILCIHINVNDNFTTSIDRKSTR